VAAGAAILVVAAVVLLVRSSANVPSGSAAASIPDPPAVSSGSLAEGRPAPDFTGTAFDGQKVTLSDLRGKPVLINFFASWCTSCEHELPGIQRAYVAHKDQGFVVLGVNSLENGDGVGFYHRFGLTFPAVYDPGKPGKIGAAYHVTSALPASIFIDKSGNVDRIYKGEITPATIEDELKRIG
jgi:peroxiredoxin